MWLDFILKDFISLLMFFARFCIWFVGGVSSGGIGGDCERNDVCVLNAAGDHFEEERGLFSGSQFWTRSEFCQRADEGGTHNNAKPITSIEAQLPPPQHLSSLKTRHNFEGVNAELQCCYLSRLDYGLAGRQFRRWSKGVLVVGG